MAQQEVLRAFRLVLDPTDSQSQVLNRHAGTARWAFNYALGLKRAAHICWRVEVNRLVEAGIDEKVARKQAGKHHPVPRKMTIQKGLNRIKGDSRVGEPEPETLGPHRPCPWWWEVSTYAFQSAFEDADTAWKNWMDSLTGKRAGAQVGYPRFKGKGARRSFRLHHDAKRPTIRLDGYRRLVMPRIGSVRLHSSAKKLAKLVAAGNAVINSVTVTQRGNRWYASVLAKTTQEIPEAATKRQAESGGVGVDVGTKVMAALSKPLDIDGETTLFVDNPRHLAAEQRRLQRAQKALSRTEKGSNRRKKAIRRVARIHHAIAERRASALHAFTKRLATEFETVCIEDLNVKGMTASAKGNVEQPGKNVRQKAGLNRSILDVGFGEFRRQLEYKTNWYGSRLVAVDQWFASSRICSMCGWRNDELTLADRTFHCGNCDTSIDRDLNAARNIEREGLSQG